jgi:hypothetical protein
MGGYRLRAINGPALATRDPMYLVGWSRPFLFGERCCLAVVSSGGDPLTWKTSRGAEAALAKAQSGGSFAFDVEPF